ncbi:MAG: hypothetical protein PHU85_04920, partial [Phycisphaerae bacterium]|nr:hypothetical protein [Phycisphaerae bacterium]
MSLTKSSLLLALVLALAAASTALAQPGQPRIGYVYPAGGQAGTTFEVTVGGQFLDGANRAYITGPGVTATVIELIKPVNQGQINDLREKLQELQKITDKDDATTKEIAGIVRKLFIFARRPLTPAIAESVRVRITLAADAEPGRRELRLGTGGGLTNPRPFCIDRLAEFTEKSATTVPDTLALRDLRDLQLQRIRNQGVAVPPGEMRITIPAAVNGQILPGGVNRYRFAAAKGTRLVAAARARELIPYLADAVPGWFQASLTLLDAKGNELTYADHFRFHQDPVLYYEIPADGDYVLEIRDTIFRGREDFVYRITVGQLPFVTGIFPLGGRTGVQTPVEVTGWNLPATPAVLDGRGKTPGIYPLLLTADANSVAFAIDDLPEVLEREPNHSLKDAQPVAAPAIINGRIGKAGEWDVFRIDGKAGSEMVAEVVARRLSAAAVVFASSPGVSSRTRSSASVRFSSRNAAWVAAIAAAAW